MKSIKPRHRIYLSPPEVGREVEPFVRAAFEQGWVAPVGPNLDAFEVEFAEYVDAAGAVALVSGTAALHLALRCLGVGPGDRVLVSTFTFVASAVTVRYVGAEPVFVDSELTSWNMAPEALEEALAVADRQGRRPKAAIVVDIYGQCANYEAILPICQRYGVPVIEDAAEALGATCNGKSAGSFGLLNAFSFNGNKIITTSGGGMLTSRRSDLIERARHLAAQARDPAHHYEHTEVGYNYRMSNVLAGIGRGQLRLLEDRVRARRRVFEAYRDRLADLPGLAFMPEAPWGRSTRWLTCITIDPEVAGTDREAVRQALEAANIESRPVWKPLHLQPVFAGCETFGGTVAEALFERGLCLPSGSALSESDIDRICEVVRSCWRRA